MSIFREIAGYTFGHADIVRRAMSKKKAKEMENERQAFIFGEKDKDGNVVCHGAIAAGISEEVATEIFDTMSSFAAYAFNKSHATAYAYTSYRTAYLKAHYPCEYLASLLTSVLGNMGKTAVYVDQAQRMHISVLGPDINESRDTYTVVKYGGKRAIRFGLLGIKNVGKNFLAEVVTERSSGRFTSFENFVSRMSGRDLNKRQVESLIKSGAFDSLGTKRSQLLSEYERIIDIYLKKERNKSDGQLDLFSIGNVSFDNDYPEADYAYPDLDELPTKERLRQEKESMGMYFSGHPFDDFEAHAKAFRAVPIGEILSAFEEDGESDLYEDHQRLTVAGIITSRINKQTRAGAPMAFITVEDHLGEMELVIFPKVLERYSFFLTPDVPVAAYGELSITEDAPPKLLVNKMEMLKAGYVPEEAPVQQTEETPKEKTISAPSSDKPQTLYLKVENLSCEACRRACSILEIFEGATPVIFYDVSTKKYVKAVGRSTSIQPTMFSLLKKILGDSAVILK
jgi:DNA polymerase-3 subunit alpha